MDYIDLDLVDELIAPISAAVTYIDSEAQDNAPQLPLEAFLTLYARSFPKDTYVEYYRGLRLLLGWLGPVQIPTSEGLPLVTRYTVNWEIQEISKIIGCKQEVIADIFHRWYVTGTTP